MSNRKKNKAQARERIAKQHALKLLAQKDKEIEKLESQLRFAHQRHVQVLQKLVLKAIMKIEEKEAAK